MSARCPVCEGDAVTSPAPGEGPWSLADCPDCGLRFTDPMQHPGKGWYEETPIYDFRGEEDEPATPTLEGQPLDWRHETFFRFFPEPGKVLDLGCGEGQFLARARDRGWEPHGAEFDARGVAIARDVFQIEDVRQVNILEDPPEPGGDHDAVTAFDFLEHMPDPVWLVDHMRRSLKPGGRALISVPRMDRWPRVYDPEVDIPPHHLTLWTPESGKALFEKAGLVDVQVAEKPLTVGDLFMHYRWREARRLGESPRRRLVHYPIYAFLLITVPLARALGWAAGHTLVVVGRRPEEDS